MRCSVGNKFSTFLFPFCFAVRADWQQGGPLKGLREQANMSIYAKELGTDISTIKGNCDKQVSGTMKLIIMEQGRKVKFSGEQRNG